MDFDQKLQFGAVHPTFFWPPLKMVIFHVKSLKIEIFSIFQLCHLKSLNLVQTINFYGCVGHSGHFFWRNREKRELQLFLPIFGKIALDIAKWLSETHRMGHKASFRLHFTPRTHFRFF